MPSSVTKWFERLENALNGFQNAVKIHQNALKGLQNVFQSLKISQNCKFPCQLKFHVTCSIEFNSVMHYKKSLLFNTEKMDGSMAMGKSNFYVGSRRNS